jgi:hypothetical protein
MSSALDGLAAALGGPGGAAPPDDTGADTGGGGVETYQTSLDALDGAEEALHAFIQLDQDEPDRALAGQALQIVLKLKAANQQSMQSGDMKGLSRMLASGQGGGPVG